MESLRLIAIKVQHIEDHLESFTVGQLETDLEWLGVKAAELKASGADPRKDKEVSELLGRINNLISDIESELPTQRRRSERTESMSRELEDLDLDQDDN